MKKMFHIVDWKQVLVWITTYFHYAEKVYIFFISKEVVDWVQILVQGLPSTIYLPLMCSLQIIILESGA